MSKESQTQSKSVVKSKVSKGQAEKEFFHWLGTVRRVRDTVFTEKNPDLVEARDNAVQNFIDGVFSLNNVTGEITQKLLFPIGEDFDEPIKELVYATRLHANAFDKSRKYQNPDDNTKMRLAISVLSKCQMALIDKMELSDFTIAQDIMVFYMVG